MFPVPYEVITHGMPELPLIPLILRSTLDQVLPQAKNIVSPAPNEAIAVFSADSEAFGVEGVSPLLLSLPELEKYILSPVIGVPPEPQVTV